ncbi:MAG: hypothetical protein QM742_13020 [Aquabacterium sp.]
MSLLFTAMPWRARARAGACALACCVIPLWAQANPFMEELKSIGDPTRPPYGAMRKGSAQDQAAAVPADGSAPDAAATKPKPRPVHLKLQGIRYDAARGHGVAMINDEIVEVGDSVAGMKVVSISSQMAVLKGESGVRKLRLQIDPDEQASATDASSHGSQTSQNAKAPDQGGQDKQTVPDSGADETARSGRKEDQ